MTNMAQIHEFYKVIFQATVLKFVDLLGGCKVATNAKFQLNISKMMPARPKNTGDMGCEYH